MINILKVTLGTRCVFLPIQISSSFVDSLGVPNSEEKLRLLQHYVHGNGDEWEKVLTKEFGHDQTSANMSHHNWERDREETEYLSKYLDEANRKYDFDPTSGSSSFEQLVVQNCSDLILRIKFGAFEPKFMYDAFLGRDLGTCCWLYPSVDFTPLGLKAKRDTPVKNGVHKGYEILMDMEGTLQEDL